ncbi:hypothetical protein GQX74_011977 [Glossina fuscipes]|nr:hypothetical protein GQX74_011977 [Glossina fuscipes]
MVSNYYLCRIRVLQPRIRRFKTWFQNLSFHSSLGQLVKFKKGFSLQTNNVGCQITSDWYTCRVGALHCNLDTVTVTGCSLFRGCRTLKLMYREHKQQNICTLYKQLIELSLIQTFIKTNKFHNNHKMFNFIKVILETAFDCFVATVTSTTTTTVSTRCDVTLMCIQLYRLGRDTSFPRFPGGINKLLNCF